LTGSNARVVFTRRARIVGDSVRTTFGREKNTEAHGKRLQRLHTSLVRFCIAWKGWLGTAVFGLVRGCILPCMLVRSLAIRP